MLARSLLLLSIIFITVSCSHIELQRRNGPGWYLVKPTDTLYSIAWRYGLDYRELAAWNDLQEPYQITPGQQLVLIRPVKNPTLKPSITPKTRRSEPSVVVKTLTPDYNRVIRWRWPTAGKVVKRFDINDLESHGIDIAGEPGQPVYAVADGKVVYSGKGLADYGNLVIVKHNDTFLSAYAFIRKRLVVEGKTVQRGDLIAEMGQGGDDMALLHFQIRKDGKPVDPQLYLPKP